MAIVTDIVTESRYKFDRKKVRQTVERVLKEHGVENDAEVCVTVVGVRKMTAWHIKYLHEEGPTDVMSWPLEGVTYPDKRLYLGDIAVCYPVAMTQAIEKQRTIDDEICDLVGHGCLHLLGIHHE